MTLSGKTALVTGATGFLGGALAKRLAADGAQVRALARSPEKAASLRDMDNIEIVHGDVTDAVRMREVIPGCDYVFHVAVSYGDWEQQHAVNVDGTRHVMGAAAEAKVDNAIYVSSIAAYGYSRTGLITEEDALMPVPDEQYNITKIKAETIMREMGAQRRLSYSIIRPGIIYGPGSDQWTRRMFQRASRKPIIWIGDGSGSTFPIHVDDVVDMLLVLATHPAAIGEAFNCVNTTPVTWRKFVLAYGKLAGGENWLPIPVVMLTAAASLISTFAGQGSHLKALSQMAPALTRKAKIDMTKARDRLGWQPKIDLKTGIESCVPYLREKGLLT